MNPVNNILGQDTTSKDNKYAYTAKTHHFTKSGRAVIGRKCSLCGKVKRHFRVINDEYICHGCMEASGMHPTLFFMN